MTPRSSGAAFRVVVLALALAAAAAGCSSSNAAAPSTTSSGATSTTEAPLVATSLLGKRYCEVLLVRIGTSGATADVYNTFPLNACPAAEWTKLDTKTIATAAGVPLAVLNGPRFWLMDRIEKSASSDRIRKTFGGITMIREASLDIGPLATARKPYTLHSVDRSTVFTFDAGRTVYELTAPGGAVYVMQSWSQQIDPTLSQTDLATLGARLHLPAGWKYRARKLTAALRVTTTTTNAQVLQDDLDNSYSLETTG